MHETTTKTESELLFEAYLKSNNYKEWEFEPEFKNKNKRPDYLLSWDRKDYLFEIKEMHSNNPLPQTGAYHTNPYKGLRYKIEEGKKKFREFKEYPCSLVVCNISNWEARLDPLDVFGAMLGDAGFSIQFDPVEGKMIEGTEQEAILGGGAMIRSKNTTINAVIVLEKFSAKNPDFLRALNEKCFQLESEKGCPLEIEEELQIRMGMYKCFPNVSSEVVRLKVMENSFARVPLAKDIFQGPFDERWVLEDEPKRVYAGPLLTEIEELENLEKR